MNIFEGILIGAMVAFVIVLFFYALVVAYGYIESELNDDE